MTTTTVNKEPPGYPVIYDTWDQYSRSLGGDINGQDPNVLGSFMSCGVSVMAGLSYTTPAVIVRKILEERAQSDKKRIKEAFVTFSDTDHNQECGGNALYKYITENKLGKIVEFGPRMNPNTGNMIKMWVWEPPHKSLSPKDRFMPIYGKKMLTGVNGTCRYEDADPRFQEHRAAAAAEPVLVPPPQEAVRLSPAEIHALRTLVSRPRS